MPEHDDIIRRRLTTSFLSQTVTSGGLCKQTPCVCVAVWLNRATVKTKVLVRTHLYVVQVPEFCIMYR